MGFYLLTQCTTEGAWEVQSLLDAWKPDHGFTLESKAIRNLAEILSTYSKEEQRLFLQFVSGSPRLPVGGTEISLDFTTASDLIF